MLLGEHRWGEGGGSHSFLNLCSLLIYGAFFLF